jgi:GT2 family glycosyltransferase
VTDGSVCLAYVHPNEVAHSWHQSVLDLVGWDLAHEQRLMRGGVLAMRCGTDGLVKARNDVARRFLAGDAEWLFVVDTDMGFGPDTVDRLIAAADPVERPIVGALCFAQREVEQDGMSGFRCEPRPTIIDWVEVDGGRQFAGRADWEPGSLVQCAATGMACVVIHRSVVETIGREHGTWYDRIPTADGLLGEDVSFCVRAGAAGFPVHVDTSVTTTHLKQFWLSEQDYRAFRELRGE